MQATVGLYVYRQYSPVEVHAVLAHGDENLPSSTKVWLQTELAAQSSQFQ